MKKILRLILIIALAVTMYCIAGCDVAFVPQDDTTATPNASESKDWGSSVENIDFSELTYCAYGDSITYGANYLDGYKQMENPYPTLVADTLGLKSYKNAGVSGATFVSNVDSRVCVADVVKDDKQSYDIISVMAGVNDFSVCTKLGAFGDTDTNTIYGSLDFIARTIKSNNPDAFVFFMTPYKSGHNGSCLTNNSAGYNLQDVANAVKIVSATYNIPVLDMFADGKYEVYGMYSENSDKLHPNQDFVTLYTAPQIVRFIRANYKGVEKYYENLFVADPARAGKVMGSDETGDSSQGTLDGMIFNDSVVYNVSKPIDVSGYRGYKVKVSFTNQNVDALGSYIFTDSSGKIYTFGAFEAGVLDYEFDILSVYYDLYICYANNCAPVVNIITD